MYKDKEAERKAQALYYQNNKTVLDANKNRWNAENRARSNFRVKLRYKRAIVTKLLGEDWPHKISPEKLETIGELLSSLMAVLRDPK